MPCLHRVLLGSLLLVVSFGRQLDAQPERLALANAIASELQLSGARLERPHVVVYFEAGVIPEADQARWAGWISEGVDNIERFLKSSFGSTRLEYYVSSKVRDTSFSIPGYDAPPRIFLASDRVVRGAAPYIHEAVHHLVFRLAPQQAATQPHFWIFEGFPSYVEDAVVARYGGVAGRVFVQEGNQAVDDEARAMLASPKGREVLAFVGRPGLPPGMEDRQTVARPFYVLGQSLTKHLIGVIGLEAFVTSILPHLLNTPKFEAELQRVCGKSLGRLTEEWLAGLEGRATSSEGPAPPVK